MLMSKIIQFLSYRQTSATMSCKPALICLKCSLLGLFLLFLQPVSAQDDWSDLDAQLKTRQKALGNDFTVLIWKNDTIAYKKDFGQFNSKTQAPVGDASKWFTAALVMVLVEEGKVSLDDKISQYVPEFARYGKKYITLRECLSHMTGVEDKVKVFQKKKFESLEEEVNSFAAHEIRNNPGKDFWYGSIGTNIAGRVLEVVTKKKFDILAKQKLFTPLTMRRTSFTTIDNSSLNPSGGAVTTADDFMQFLVMLLNKGKHKGKQILSEESIEELIRIQTKPELIKSAPKAMQGYNYALGSWVLEEKDGKATALASAGLTGTWPMVDYCRGYAFLLLTKEPVEKEKEGLYTELKKVVDAQSSATCQ